MQHSLIFFIMFLISFNAASDNLAPSAEYSEAGMNPDSKTIAYGQLLQQAENLLKAGKAEAAYLLLEPYAFIYSGNVAFDHLLGTAALDSGRPDMATFAFERVLALNPDAAGSRLEMARAYFMLKDYVRAKREFQIVLKQQPSPAARSNIEKYLEEIAFFESDSRTRLGGFMEISTGRDTNVNNATSQSQIFVDSLATTATLEPANIQMADNYMGLFIGGNVFYRLNERYEAYASVSARKRSLMDQKMFDSTGLDALAGIIFTSRHAAIRMGANGGQLSLGNTPNHRSSGLHAELSNAPGTANLFRISLQYMQYRFIDTAMLPNDYDLHFASAGWQHLSGEGQTSTTITFQHGYEKDTSTLQNLPSIPDGGRTDGSKLFNGIRFGIQTSTGGNGLIFMQAGTQLGNYARTNYWFQKQRVDRFSDITLGYQWHIDKRWDIRTQISHAFNESSIELYNYRRTDASISIRREFR